ncbi:hypothetical protein NLG97_g10653 [Lecanicillium saksenae]|uniref:Uncharacterized protein n=1 Tax=Lecanicillium saksenae TaxID=468837 RepID=A0ACC1QFS5_9HYPO|nr:hypothetical protein NLG97_g10653 [Lecanicillium saksenae]
MGIAQPTPGHDGLPAAEEWMGAPAEQQPRTQSKTLNDRPRNGDGSSIDQTNRRSGAERHMSRNSANPDEIVFAPPRINFSSSRSKLLDGDKAAKELEQGRFGGIRSSDNDRARDGRGNTLRRRGDSDYDGEGWSTVKPRKSFGAEGAERFSGKMGGNYRDEVKSGDRDGNKDRQSKTADAFGRDKDRDADGRTRNGLGRKMEPWNKSESNADGTAPERRDRDRTKSWRDRDPEASADNRGGDRRWGRDREQRAERDPEWFDEPAKEPRDVHTQQDFQKWMEQMKKAKNAQENQAAETLEPEKPVRSAPAIEQGPDKFFMAFGGGASIDPKPQTEQPEAASKPKGAGGTPSTHGKLDPSDWSTISASWICAPPRWYGRWPRLRWP